MENNNCLNCKHKKSGEVIAGRFVIQVCELTNLPIAPQDCQMECIDWENKID